MSPVFADRRLSVSSGRRGRGCQRHNKPLTKAPLVTNLTGSMENVEDER
jgi:hypothetical protein